MHRNMAVPVLRILAKGDIRVEEFRAYLAALEHAHNSYLVFEQVLESVGERPSSDGDSHHLPPDLHWPATPEGIAAKVPEAGRLRLRRVRFESPGFIEVVAAVPGTFSSLMAIYMFIEEQIRNGEHGQTMRRLEEGEVHAPIRTEELKARWLEQMIEQFEQERTRKTAILQRTELPRHMVRQLERELIEWPKQMIDAHIERGTITGAELINPDFDRGTSSSDVELVWIPGGSFLMGSPEDEAGRLDAEGPRHDVQVGDFYLCRYPVTNEQYSRFIEANPGLDKPTFWGDPQYNQPKQPVVGVSWDDARLYCAWAGLRLPSEAEWEYACRAGTTARYWSGDEDADLARVGWYDGNSGNQLLPVGEKAPNPFDLHDMHGNVWEWVEDDWHESYNGAPTDGSAWVDENRTVHRVLRGGSWNRDAGFCRSACRSYGHAGFRHNLLGFRPAMSRSPDP